MECVIPDFYDLEEGEIPDYDVDSPGNSPKIIQEFSAQDDYSHIYHKEVYFGNAGVNHKSRSRHCYKRKKDRYLNKCKLYDKYRKHSRKNILDFDEARKSLLEKLKKQKEKERIEKMFQFPLQDSKTSDIEEVNTLVFDSDSLDKSEEQGNQNKSDEKEVEKKMLQSKDGEDDEMDLDKLRLKALASNKKKPKLQSTCDGLSHNLWDQPDEENDLDMGILNDGITDKNENNSEWDRTELLLRAEALKTALLKKHQKRMMKLKTEKRTDASLSNENDTAGPLSAEAADVEGNSERSTNIEHGMPNLSETNLKFEADAFKENVEETDVKMKNEISKASDDYSTLGSGLSSKKAMARARAKKRRKKSISLANSLKENDKSEAGEEDDRTLRSQLLSDLLKRKPRNDSEKKSILLDSAQTGINRPAIMVPPKRHVAFAENSSLKKVNVNTRKKPAVVTATPPVVPKAEIQRIIIHLGSEDSSDDDLDVSSSKQTKRAITEENCEEKKGISTATINATKFSDQSLQASYEKSVELLLSQARKKIEGEKKKANGDHLATPEAVYKHLPPSQRLEYIRLKQKIAEQERLKNLKMQKLSGPCKLDNQPPNNGVGVSRINESVKETCQQQGPAALEKTIKTSSSSSTAVQSVFSASKLDPPFGAPVKTVDRGSYVTTKNAVKAPANASSKKIVLPTSRKPKTFLSNQQFAIRAPSTQILLTKAKLVLKKIKIEKTIEKNYDREIVKLKNQLSLFEKKKSEQRIKVKKLSEEITKLYKLIEATDKVEKKPATSWTTGKVPAGGSKPAKQNSESIYLKAGNEDKPDTTIIENGDGSTKEVGGARNVIETPTLEYLPPIQKISTYNSPLQSFTKVSNAYKKLDPNVEMCQFDLMGVCKDEDCSYQHVSREKLQIRPN